MFEDLTPEELELAGDCLRAAADGPFFPSSEFSALLGLERAELREMANRWPARLEPWKVETALNNTLVNLLGYPIDSRAEWPSWISGSPGRVLELLNRLRAPSS